MNALACSIWRISSEFLLCVLRLMSVLESKQNVVCSLVSSRQHVFNCLSLLLCCSLNVFNRLLSKEPACVPCWARVKGKPLPDSYKAKLERDAADNKSNEQASEQSSDDGAAAESSEEASSTSSSDHATEVADRAVERVEKRKTVTVPAIVLPSDTTEGRTLQELFRVSTFSIFPLYARTTHA